MAVSTYTDSVTLPPVTVTVDGKEDKIVTLTATYQILQAPTITDVSPDTGPADGGTTVTIIGTGFTGAGSRHFRQCSGDGFHHKLRHGDHGGVPARHRDGQHRGH